MLPAVHSTVCPDVIEVDGLMIISVPNVPAPVPESISSLAAVMRVVFSDAL
jgi:hypothetical protein